MKLFRVRCEIEYEVLCLAESAEDAERAVEYEYAEEELDVRSFCDLLDVSYVEEVTDIKQIGREWLGCLVYHSGKNDIAIEDALALCKPPEDPS